ncbi:putative haloacid dehalogenase-like hydrolase [Lyophyllum shimeji]|uniref:Haloacid dehalogenase-like hydrolase n=1 Tax=Lyophyllum shimeji TaxID=47721 RepID=A0A9P3PFV7_LYOSH|nr:putative haloacid dehalogenase-like hydrolase [Lyophyllum shimeji]
MTATHFKAVIFDIGGVVLRSPFIAIATYERELGIPENYLNCSIVARGSQGAWQKFERGEMPLFEFYEAFGRELSDTVNGNRWYEAYCRRKELEVPPLPKTLNVNGRDLFGSMMRGSKLYDPHILEAIHRIRATGRYKIIALTNNFAKADVPPAEARFLGWDEGATPYHLRSLFDDFCDSSTLGMRKPEPEFYLVACKRNGIQPHEAIFLDDIGMNLKAARGLGMETIRVPIGKTLEAVKILEAKLGIDLTSSEHQASSKL